MGKPIPFGPFRWSDADGVPLSGGKLYAYVAGTSTPKNTYTDSTLDTPNANPVILDSEGYAQVWLGSGNYKFILKDSNDVDVWPQAFDNVEGTVDLIETITASSTTSVSLGTGSKSFEIEANKALPVNSWVLVSYDPDPTAKYMIGQVTDYDGTDITITMTTFTGSGTYADWTLSLSGPPGPAGPTGPSGGGSGDLLAAQNLADLDDIPTARGNLGLGTAALLDVGTIANKVLQLNGSAQIPAVSGALVTNLNGSEINSGTIAIARIASGTPDGTKFVRDDGTLAVPSATIPTTRGAVYTSSFMQNVDAGNVSGGASTSGSGLRYAKISSTGVVGTSGSGTPSGTWVNMGSDVTTNDATEWVRSV